jgi:hypothetical protein
MIAMKFSGDHRQTAVILRAWGWVLVGVGGFDDFSGSAEKVLGWSFCGWKLDINALVCERAEVYLVTLRFDLVVGPCGCS